MNINEILDKLINKYRMKRRSEPKDYLKIINQHWKPSRTLSKQEQQFQNFKDEIMVMKLSEIYRRALGKS